jgi:hypothetical protein
MREGFLLKGTDLKFDILNCNSSIAITSSLPKSCSGLYSSRGLDGLGICDGFGAERTVRTVSASGIVLASVLGGRGLVFVSVSR